MFDKSVLKSGLDHIIKPIDYNGIVNAPLYYRRILAYSVGLTPNFCTSYDPEAVALAIKEGRELSLSIADQNFIRLQRVLSLRGGLNRRELLTKIDGYMRAFPNDSMMSLIIGKGLCRHELYADANRYLHQSVQADPENGLAWAMLGLMAALAHDHGLAFRSAEQAIRLGEFMSNTQTNSYVFPLLAMGLPAKIRTFSTESLLARPLPIGQQNEFEPDTIEIILEPETIPEKPIVFFAADEIYFEKFGHSLMRSLIAAKNDATIHIHIMAPNGAGESVVKKYASDYKLDLIFSAETPHRPHLMENNSYLASNRFINAPYFMRRHRRPYLILDTDSLLNDDKKMRAFLEGMEKPVLYNTDHGPVWDLISAPFVFLPFNEIGLAFMDKCSAFLREQFGKPRTPAFWYIDQLALLGAFMHYHDNVDLCPAKEVSDIDCGDEAIFWTLSNDKKHPKYLQKAAELRERYPI